MSVWNDRNGAGSRRAALRLGFLEADLQARRAHRLDLTRTGHCHCTTAASLKREKANIWKVRFRPAEIVPRSHFQGTGSSGIQADRWPNHRPNIGVGGDASPGKSLPQCRYRFLEQLDCFSSAIAIQGGDINLKPKSLLDVANHSGATGLIVADAKHPIGWHEM